jgi:hypothetical protein
LEQAQQSLSFLAVLDLAGNSGAAQTRHEDQVAARNAAASGEDRSFRADLFFEELDGHFLAGMENRFDGWLYSLVRKGIPL